MSWLRACCGTAAAAGQLSVAPRALVAQKTATRCEVAAGFGGGR